MTPIEMMSELEKQEEEILKQHLDNIQYNPINTLPAYVYMLNRILPENPELINAFIELEITDERIMAEYLLDAVKKLKRNSW